MAETTVVYRQRWRMEEVLEEYAQPYDPKRPQVGVDERPCQWPADSRNALPSQPGQPKRYDYESVREGICNLFMIFEPLTGWRTTPVTAHRKQADFAFLMRDLVDGYYPDAHLIRVVLDYLNIHSPAEARPILRKLEFHFTPKHGSWLNRLESELSMLVRQCLGQPLPHMAALTRQVTPWQLRPIDQQPTIHCQFSVEKAPT